MIFVGDLVIRDELGGPQLATQVEGMLRRLQANETVRIEVYGGSGSAVWSLGTPSVDAFVGISWVPAIYVPGCHGEIEQNMGLHFAHWNIQTLILKDWNVQE